MASPSTPPTSGDATTPSRRSRIPRWLAPALGVWIILGTAALANATAVAVRGEVVVALLGVLAVAHGLVHRRWLAAGPAAAVALLAAGLLSLGLVSGVQGVYRQGPADSAAPVIIWVAAFLVAALDILWGLIVHTRTGRTAQRGPNAPLRQRTQQQAATQEQLRRCLDHLDEQISTIEAHLTTVP